MWEANGLDQKKIGFTTTWLIRHIQQKISEFYKSVSCPNNSDKIRRVGHMCAWIVHIDLEKARYALRRDLARESCIGIPL